MKIWKPEDPLPGQDVFEEEEPCDKSWIFEEPQWSEWAEEGGAEFNCATRDVPFLALIKGRVEFSDAVWGDDDAVWVDWMQKYGIAAELQDAIMDPTFKQLRSTRTCEQWVLDTIDMRYDTFYDTGTTSKSGRSKDLQDTESEHYGNTVASGSNFAPAETPGVTVLYEAVALNRFWNTTCPLLDSKERLNNMSHLRKHRTIVFDQSGLVIYLGTSLETAQLHASYLRRLSNGLDSNVVIVQLHMPDIALQNATVPIYFPSDDWKKLVWYYQKGGEDKELRDEVSRLCRARVIVGNLTSRPKEALSELGSWEDLTEKHVLKLDGNADGDIHYAFKDDDGEDVLEDNVTNGKIIPFLTAEYLQWMEEHQDLSQCNIARSYCCLQ